MRRLAFLVLAGAACGGGKGAPPAPDPDKAETRDAGPRDDAAAAVVQVAAQPLGLPDLEAYQWRARGGHAAFRVARKAEAREDWATVVARCREALAADPTHLEAAWLLAAGLGALGKHDELLAPLRLAAAGDFGKWGPASLALAELQPFLATPVGAAWRQRVEADRAAYADALAAATVVRAGGDLYALALPAGDAAGTLAATRWYRLTRTHGAVIAALPVPSAGQAPVGRRIVYVTRQRARLEAEHVLAVGIVDLARGRTSRPIKVAAATATIRVAPALTPEGGAWIGVVAPGGRAVAWRHLDDDGRLTALPPKSVRLRGAWLEIAAGAARLHALPLAHVAADWDEHGLASAVRLVASKRVVAGPEGGQIDGHTAAWSPDRSHLAFVARLDDACTPDAVTGAFVADAATGAVRELARGAGAFAVAWIGERRVAVAVAGAGAVDVHDLAAATSARLAGADGLLATPIRTCAPPAAAPVVAEPTPAPDDD